MLLSLVIPAFNEASVIGDTVRNLQEVLTSANIEHEFVVVNDNSNDRTEQELQTLKRQLDNFFYFNNNGASGYGNAVRLGLTQARGAGIAIVMADGSEEPEDVITFYHKLQEGYDCVFGSRFLRDGLIDKRYPPLKLWLNRMGNRFVALIFSTQYDDISNAFKMYRHNVIRAIMPTQSQFFELNLELPLKAIILGYRYAIVPNRWRPREGGVSTFRPFCTIYQCLPIIRSCYRMKRGRA